MAKRAVDRTVFRLEIGDGEVELAKRLKRLSRGPEHRPRIIFRTLPGRLAPQTTDQLEDGIAVLAPYAVRAEMSVGKVKAGEVTGTTLLSGIYCILEGNNISS